DAWIPNSGSAKLAFTVERWSEGLRYVRSSWGALSGLSLMSAAALLPLFKDEEAKRRIVVLLSAAATWLLYVIVIGGDIFPAWRHLVVVVVLSCFGVAEGVRWLAARGPRSRYWTTVGAVALLSLHLAQQRFDPQIERAHEERWEWDGAVVGSFLHRHFGGTGARLAVDSAGALPYFARLTTIDMLGINDRTLATNRPPDFGRGALGHELGNGDYVLSQKPDLVVFGLPTGQRDALYRSGVEMQQHPSFAREYKLVTFETTGSDNGSNTVTAHIWVRVASERLGYRQDERRIVVPGFMLAVGQSAAREDGHGRLGTTVSSFAPGAIRVPDVPAGCWRVEPSSHGAVLQMSIRAPGREPLMGGAPTNVALDQDGAVEVALRPGVPGLSHVTKLVLTRLDGATGPARTEEDRRPIRCPPSDAETESSGRP
ncbi:MAG: hypothetical protein ACOC1F_01035, partial [Myxococcota bacterium]